MREDAGGGGVVKVSGSKGTASNTQRDKCETA